jgi:hypothetical protein
MKLFIAAKSVGLVGSQSRFRLPLYLSGAWMVVAAGVALLNEPHSV